MKKLILCLTLCFTFFLVSCSDSSEIQNKDYTEKSSELTELLNTTEPYSYYREWKNAEVSVTEDSFEILYPGYDYPLVKVFEDGGKAMIQQYFQSVDKLFYTKGAESKQAYLTIDSYVHMEQYNRVLQCTLAVNDGEDVYRFFYDEKLNTIFEYNDSIKEELVFTKSLQNSILSYCENALYTQNTKMKQSKQIVEWLVKEIGYEHVTWQEDQPIAELEYALMDHSDDYEIMFEDFTPDEIYPLYHWYGQEIAENLFVVKKDGLYGVVNKEIQLVVPFISTSIPTAEEYHVHYTPAEQYRNTSGYYLPYSHYHICQGDHGSNGHYYFLVKGTNQVIKARYGHEGPLGIVEFEENELNGQLNTYELIEISDSTDNIIWIEDTKYARTGKYGVFSEEGIVTDAVYDWTLSVNADIAAVRKGEYWGYVNSSGDEVIPCVYDAAIEIGRFKFGYPAKDGYAVAKNDKGMFGVLDYSGDVMIPFDYEDATPYIDGTVLLKRDSEWLQVNPFTASYTSMSYPISSGTVKIESYKNPSIGLKLQYTGNSTVSTRYFNESVNLKHGERFNDLTLEKNGAKLFVDFIKVDGSRDMNDEELYNVIIKTYPDLFSDLYIGLLNEIEIGGLVFRECTATIGTGTSIINDFYFRRHGDQIILIRLDYDADKISQGEDWLNSFESYQYVLDLGMGTLPEAEGELIYFGNPETNDMFNPVGNPTYVSVDRKNLLLDFGAEGGCIGELCSYTGSITELTPGIYKAHEPRRQLDGSQNAGIDFYIVLKRDRLYMILQEMTLEELKAYESEDFYDFSYIQSY